MGYYLLIIGSLISGFGLWAGPLAAAVIGGDMLYAGVRMVFFGGVA